MLPNGLRVWTVRHTAIPVVTFMLLVRRGAADDPPGKEGLAAITVDMLDEGSGDRSAIEMHEALARLGAQLDSDIGSDAAVLTGRGTWLIGTHPLFFLASALMRSVRQRPYVTGAAYAAYGYLQAAASGARRYGDPEMTRFIQRFQLRALVRGKRASAERAFRSAWPRAPPGTARAGTPVAGTPRPGTRGAVRPRDPARPFPPAPSSRAEAGMKARYVPEIDGLRTIAVMSVLFYHVGFEAFAGGFVGVDVFFVISGFLITRLIRDEVTATGRLRLPALLRAPGAAAVPGAGRHHPRLGLLARRCCSRRSSSSAFAVSAVAALFSVSNVLFWLEADYFDALASHQAAAAHLVARRRGAVLPPLAGAALRPAAAAARAGPRWRCSRSSRWPASRSAEYWLPRRPGRRLLPAADPDRRARHRRAPGLGGALPSGAGEPAPRAAARRRARADRLGLLSPIPTDAVSRRQRARPLPRGGAGVLLRRRRALLGAPPAQRAFRLDRQDQLLALPRALAAHRLLARLPLRRARRPRGAGALVALSFLLAALQYRLVEERFRHVTPASVSRPALPGAGAGRRRSSSASSPAPSCSRTAGRSASPPDRLVLTDRDQRRASSSGATAGAPTRRCRPTSSPARTTAARPATSSSGATATPCTWCRASTAGSPDDNIHCHLPARLRAAARLRHRAGLHRAGGLRRAATARRSTSCSGCRPPTSSSPAPSAAPPEGLAAAERDDHRPARGGGAPGRRSSATSIHPGRHLADCTNVPRWLRLGRAPGGALHRRPGGAGGARLQRRAGDAWSRSSSRRTRRSAPAGSAASSTTMAGCSTATTTTSTSRARSASSGTCAASCRSEPLRLRRPVAARPGGAPGSPAASCRARPRPPASAPPPRRSAARPVSRARRSPLAMRDQGQRPSRNRARGCCQAGKWRRIIVALALKTRISLSERLREDWPA